MFFPDPWHKKRHHKRRLIQSPFVRLLAERLAPGGYLHLATDWQPYAEQMLEVLSAEPLLRNATEGYAPRPAYRPLTKFEQRGAAPGPRRHGTWCLSESLFDSQLPAPSPGQELDFIHEIQMAHAPRSHVPARDGLRASCVALPAGPGPRCWTSWPSACRYPPGLGRAHGRRRRALRCRPARAAPRPTGHSSAFTTGAAWRPNPEVPGEEHVLFQDELLVVADKPHFLPVTPGGRYAHQTLLARLQQRLGIDTLVPLHRIDRETAGIVAFCVQPAHRDAYHALVRAPGLRKRYEALAHLPAAPQAAPG